MDMHPTARRQDVRREVLRNVGFCIGAIGVLACWLHAVDRLEGDPSGRARLDSEMFALAATDGPAASRDGSNLIVEFGDAPAIPDAATTAPAPAETPADVPPPHRPSGKQHSRHFR